MLRWFPWKYIVSRVARARGLVDPVKLLSRLESFAQPLEVKAPLELLRAGMVFHARGLLNTGAIQHNLDWVWPFWVERQYDPRDEAFIPRAFSITHVNLTHRNWTAVGIPDCRALPLVDPGGLVTPFWDSWSLDAWIIAEDGAEAIPSRLETVDQRLDISEGLAVVTRSAADGMRLESRVEVEPGKECPRLVLHHAARSASRGWLVVSLRPYNPEGVSFVHEIRAADEGRTWKTGDGVRIELVEEPEATRMSRYETGDVYRHLLTREEDADEVHCSVGMATAAALYPLEPDRGREVEVAVPLRRKKPRSVYSAGPSWADALEGTAGLRVADSQTQFLFDAAVRTLVLHSPDEVFPGPFTYKRFWFRDAAFILAGMLAAGLESRVERTLDGFPDRQTRRGHFLSQEGEWDSNGEALWILERFCAHTGREPKSGWEKAIRRGTRWIGKKRVSGDASEPHAGLLPAGFSAEHLGPNDYYYWDDFWSVAGLRSAASLLEGYGRESEAVAAREEAADLERAIERSLETPAARLGRPGMPASPYRRLDSGAIGSLAAGYPLQLWPGDDPRLLDTVEYLLDQSFVGGGFFQDMIHSGVNPYLTLHVAQVLLRAGDRRCLDLMATVAELASPTGQWPEAIHPRTGGGCMGDGQHVWAAAEWVLAVRNAFVREEGNGLVIGAGVAPSWVPEGGVASFGPAPTAFGTVEVRIERRPEAIEVSWRSDWRTEPEAVRASLPGHEPVESDPEAAGVTVEARGVPV